MSARSLVVVMGVSGSGKSTIGQSLAERLSLPFVEADGLHSRENIAKMRGGQPLTDADRWPWLAAIAEALADAARSPQGLVVSCSALKLAYRERLRRVVGLRFVFLDLPQKEAEQRLLTRPKHFMPVSLVASQFADLERPDFESDVVTVAATAPVTEVLAEALAALRSCLPHAALE